MSVTSNFATSIRLKDVSKDFKVHQHTVSALRKINIEFSLGSKVSITGRSGSGKSTLLHVLGTLERPTSGEIFLGDISVHTLSDQQLSMLRGQKIGFVFQMNNLLPEFTALENVMMPGLIANNSQKQVQTRAKSLLESVGLVNRMNHRPGELSGGEQQRVAIARALIMQPLLLLADEPTGNLDAKTSQEIQELFMQVAEAYSMTIVIVTHDQDLARKFPNQIIMKDGGIAQVHGEIRTEELA